MTRAGYSESSPHKHLRTAHRKAESLARRPAQRTVGGAAVKMIKVFEDDEVVAAGDGKYIYDVPEDLDEAVLLKAEAWVTTVSGSGIVNVQLRRVFAGGNMLSTPLTIDVGETSSDLAATPHVVNPATAEVGQHDQIAIDVDNAGSGARGLGVTLYFTSAEVASVAVTGAKGDPGGVTDFQGPWATSTAYVAGAVVTNGGVAYVATSDHTSGASTEPGVGGTWQTVWMPMADVPMTAGISLNVLSSSGAIPDGVKAIAVMPFDATITRAAILADQAGDAEVDIWKSDFGGYPPDVSDSICGGNPPTLTGALKNEDTTLPGWTTALAEGDILVFVAAGVSTARRIAVALDMAK